MQRISRLMAGLALAAGLGAGSAAALAPNATAGAAPAFLRLGPILSTSVGGYTTLASPASGGTDVVLSAIVSGILSPPTGTLTFTVQSTDGSSGFTFTTPASGCSSGNGPLGLLDPQCSGSVEFGTTHLTCGVGYNISVAYSGNAVSDPASAPDYGFVRTGVDCISK